MRRHYFDAFAFILAALIAFAVASWVLSLL